MADVGVSELFKLYGADAAAVLNEQRNVEPTVFGSSLPPVEFRGVARLSKVEFQKTKDGEKVMLVAVGKIVAPQWVDGQFLEGCETQQFVVIDPSDVRASIKQIMDVVKLAAGSDVFKDARDVFQHVPLIDKLAKSRPIYFRVETEFREEKIDPKTGKPYPKNVWQRWKGNVPHFSPPGGNGHTSTGTGAAVAAAPANGSTGAPAPWGERAAVVKPTPVAASVVPAPVEEAKPVPRPVPKSAGAVDWAKEVELAKEKDAASDSRVRARCISLGKTEDEIDEATWETILSWLVPSSGTAAPVPSADDTFPLTGGDGTDAPEEGSVCQYTPIDPKDATGNTRMKRSRQCEITELNHDTRQMTLVDFKNRANKWVGVSWDDPNVKYTA